MGKLNVLDVTISYYEQDTNDFLCLTDMVRNIENGPSLIEKWLRNKNTIEFLGIWEEIYNPEFNSPNSRELKIKRDSTDSSSPLNNGWQKQIQKALSQKQDVMGERMRIRTLPLNLPHGFHHNSNFI